MGERITGLIRYFIRLVSPSYVPETPLPQDPGKSASLPLAEALSIVEPGVTATSGAQTQGTNPDEDARRSTRLPDGNSEQNCLKEVRTHRRTVNEPVRRRVMRGLRQDSGAPIHILDAFWKVVRVYRRNLPLTRAPVGINYRLQ